MKKSRMYINTKTWNPAVGCKYNCIYCEPSFKRQVKRVSGNPFVSQGYRIYSENIFNDNNLKGGCSYCKTFEPHYHPERLTIKKIPIKSQIFIYGHGDITFYHEDYVKKTLALINNQKFKNTTFYLQSKNPRCFNKYLDYLNDNIILLTTLETNRDIKYSDISDAPLPSQRYLDFYNLKYSRKVVTIEPIMKFDIDIFTNWIINLKKQGSLEYVWIGYNSKPAQVKIPEPSLEKTEEFCNNLKNQNIKLLTKDLRNLKI